MLDKVKFEKCLREGGMDPKISRIMAKRLSEDLAYFEADDATANWALLRGFYPGRVELYGLDESNWRDFMPDYASYMMHPYNGWQRIWVNDKLTLKYVLESEEFTGLLPRYFLYVGNDGRFTYLMDTPSDLPRDRYFLRRLLEREGILAMKPNNGTGGLGFMKVELSGGGLIVNNEPKNDDFLEEILPDLNNYIVTSYVRQHHELAAIWPGTECTLRIVLARMPSVDSFSLGDWRCMYSYARFGLSSSGGASNLSSGGIGVGLDFETGRMKRIGYRYAQFCEGGNCAYDCHPDTGFVWEGVTLPNWSIVRSFIASICERLGSLDYMGFDLIITEDGTQLLEVNTKPSSAYANIIYGPILSSDDARCFYESKGLSKYRDATALRDAYFACRL